MTKEEVMAARQAALSKAFALAVKNAIGGDKNHGWGVEDSMNVIDAVVAADAEFAVGQKEDMAKYSLSDEAMTAIREVVNPSQFRQKLESRKVLNESVKGTKATKKQLDSLLADLEVK